MWKSNRQTITDAYKYFVFKIAHIVYDASEFSQPLVNWDELHNGCGRSLLLIGPFNIGKTEFAKAHFRSPLFVTYCDNLGDFDPE